MPSRSIFISYFHVAAPPLVREKNKSTPPNGRVQSYAKQIFRCCDTIYPKKGGRICVIGKT